MSKSPQSPELPPLTISSSLPPSPNFDLDAAPLPSPSSSPSSLSFTPPWTDDWTAPQYQSALRRSHLENARLRSHLQSLTRFLEGSSESVFLKLARKMEKSKDENLKVVRSMEVEEEEAVNRLLRKMEEMRVENERLRGEVEG